MAVISITIAESTLSKIAGIPSSITVTTNVPATVFFTLDGTTPTTASSVVVNPLELPTNQSSVVFTAFATDGYTTCPVITREFKPNIVGNRTSHDKISDINFIGGARFLCSKSTPTELGRYGNISPIKTVDSPEIAGTSSGFDGTATGTSAAETDLPLNQLDIIYSETDSIGQRGTGIGNLPANVTVRVPAAVHPSTSSDANSALFNPKAKVIFQDGREEPFNKNVSQLNRPFFSLEPDETTRDGAHLFRTALEGAVPSGSFLRAHYNPRENTYNMYYMDSTVGRWIISKEPVSFNSNVVKFDSVVFPSRAGESSKVFKWLPFHYTKLI